jgi:hypothetical protein
MSLWYEAAKEDITLDGDEINILVHQDYTGNVYVIVKVEDVKALLTESLKVR